MKCDNVRELLAGHVLEALDADERDAVARHLEDCADCSALAAALTATAHELPRVLDTLDTLDAPELPASIIERLTAPPATQRARPLRRTLRVPLAAAAVVALAVLAVLAGIRSQRAIADQHDLRARLAALVGKQSIVFDVVDSPHTTRVLLLPERAGLTSVRQGLYTYSDTNDAVAFVNRLPQPHGANRYELWIRTGGTTSRAGVLSLHSGFGYLVFHQSTHARVSDAFVTRQEPSRAPAGTIVLKLARR